MHHSIGHLAASNYASRYYCYIFSQVICVDMFTEFSKNGDSSNKEVALRYRREILEKGGSEDAEDMLVGFMGRTYSIDAFKAWLSSAVKR
jgi:thimet oligopeptidase